MTWQHVLLTLIVWIVTFNVLGAIGLEWWQSLVAVVAVGVASEIDKRIMRWK